MTKPKRYPLEFYLKQPYPVTVIPAEEGGFVAFIEHLPGCVKQGETLEEALELLEDAKKAWLTDAYADGEAIPPRQGWAESFKKMAENGDDELLDDDTSLSSWDDSEWEWT